MPPEKPPPSLKNKKSWNYYYSNVSFSDFGVFFFEWKRHFLETRMPLARFFGNFYMNGGSPSTLNIVLPKTMKQKMFFRFLKNEDVSSFFHSEIPIEIIRFSFRESIFSVKIIKTKDPTKLKYDFNENLVREIFSKTKR